MDTMHITKIKNGLIVSFKIPLATERFVSHGAIEKEMLKLRNERLDKEEVEVKKQV